jgi:hypothetical protein
MRDGQYEILLLGDNDVPFREEYINGQWTVIASPGKSYHIRVNVYRDSVTGEWPHPYLRLGLFVDGADVQYWKRLDLSNEKLLPRDWFLPISSVFWGFKVNTTEIRSFVFSPTASSSSSSTLPITSRPSSSSVSDDQGTIRLVVHDARVTTGVFNNNVVTSQDRLPSVSSSSSLNQDSKFWKQPSVMTSGGRKIQNEKEKFIPLTRWENCTSEPMKIITLQYHSEDVIRYLKNPAAQQEKERENEKKRKREEEEEAEVLRLRQLEEHTVNGGEVEEIVKEKEVPFLDLEEDTPSWKVIKLKR